MADQEGTCVVQLLLPNALSSAIWTSFLNTFFFFTTIITIFLILKLSLNLVIYLLEFFELSFSF